MIRNATIAFAMMSAVSVVFAGECEDKYTRTGNALSGTDYASRVTVPDLSVVAALGQLRSIVITEKMDVITEDLDSGALLAEQRSQGATRPIPTLINVSAVGTSATIDLTIKTEKGMMTKSNVMRAYVCELLTRVQGGKAGLVAAAQGAQQESSDDVIVRDVWMFSREIAQQAKGNALAVTARNKGRAFALKGRVDYIQEDGNVYNVSFDIPTQSDIRLLTPGDHEPRVGVACLFNASQLANVLTFRKGQAATFKGTFIRYDDITRMAWLGNCQQVRK
jgi:hypothetical protein